MINTRYWIKMDVKDSEWNDEQNSGNDVGGVHRVKSG